MLDLFGAAQSEFGLETIDVVDGSYEFNMDNILSLEALLPGINEESIKAILDEELSHLVIDVKLLREVRNYGTAFVNANPDHVAFFGGCLLGVHPIRFRPYNLNEWYDGILEIDDTTVRNRILSLPNIDPEWKRGTDVMNLSCVWLVHKIFNSNLPESVKRQGMIDTLMVLQYKLITSIMTHYFKYPANEEVAQATYAALSKKFSLKTAGSWNGLLIQRSQDIIAVRSVHLDAIKRFTPDEIVQYMITDIQGRLRNIVKNLWAVFNKVKTNNDRILSSKMTGLNIDGEMVVRDMKRNYSPYLRYLHTIVGDESQFIKPEVLDVVSAAMQTMDPRHLESTLKYVCSHYRRAGGHEIEPLLDKTLLHAFHYISSESSEFLRRTDLGWLIARLKAIYMSSRSSDKDLKEMRELGESIAQKASRTKNAAQVSAIRTGLLLYIVTRTFARNHYG